MLFVKRLVGWICLLSLLTGIILMGYAFFTSVQHFLMGSEGAVVCSLPVPNPSFTVQALVANDVFTRSVNQKLESYVNNRFEPTKEYTGWQALLWSIDRLFRLGSVPVQVYDWGSSPQHNPLPNVVATAVLDPAGRVVQAYPQSLTGNVFPFGIPVHALQDSNVHQPNNDTPWEQVDWARNFREFVRKSVPEAGEVSLTRVLGQNGQVIGVLATVERHDLSILYAHQSAYSDWGSAWIALEAALVSLLIYALLLPIWVGMDAKWRGMRPAAWGIFVALTNTIGAAAYLAARLPAPGKCPNCGCRVLSKFVRCPACGVSFVAKCPTCRTRMKPGWQFCPVCAQEPMQSIEPVSQKIEPAARDIENLPVLSVLVADAETQAPLSGIVVVLDGPMPRKGLTGSDGRFVATRLMAGAYMVGASKHDYEPAVVEVKVTEDSNKAVRLALKSQPGRITGRVVDSSLSAPISQVNIYIDSSRVDRSTRTAADGTYMLDEVPSGPFTVAADADGYQPQTKLADVQPGKQSTVDFILERRDNPAETAVEGETI